MIVYSKQFDIPVLTFVFINDQPWISAWIKSISHYNDVMMGTVVSQITSLMIVYSTVYSGADQRKHQSSASLAVVHGIHRWPVNSTLKGPVTRKMFPFDDVIMWCHKTFTDDKSTLVQVMAWCRQATSHYLSHCCPRSLLPYGITRPQWVKINTKTTLL